MIASQRGEKSKMEKERISLHQGILEADSMLSLEVDCALPRCREVSRPIIKIMTYIS